MATRHHRIALTEADGGVVFHRLPVAEIADPDFRLLLEWWHGKRGERAMPARADLDPSELRHFLHRLLIIEVSYDPPDFRYRLAGSQTYDIHGVELTGRSVLDIKPEGQGRLVWNDMCEMLERRQPQHVMLQFTNQKGHPRSYRVLRLSLSQDGDAVDQVLVLQDFGVASHEMKDMYRELRHRP